MIKNKFAIRDFLKVLLQLRKVSDACGVILMRYTHFVAM